MTVKSRLQKIQEQSKLIVKINEYKGQHRYGLRSLSDQAVNYQLFTKFTGLENIEGVEIAKIECGCQKVDSGSMTGMSDCKGNSNGCNTVCYHSLAALKFAARQQGQQINFFDTFKEALIYSNLGGKLMKITSAQSKGVVWGVFK